MKSKRGTIWMSVGAVLLAAALCLTLYNRWDETRAGDEADETLSVLESAMTDSTTPAAEDISTEAQAIQSVEIDGRDYIGIVDIPALEVSLPVQAEWSKSALKKSPCRYKGSFLEGNMILAAHNYKTHFGRIGELIPGDDVYFTDTENHTYHYQVTSTETIDGADIDQMERGNWDLTLFTCTIGGKTRVTVRCTEVQGGWLPESSSASSFLDEAQPAA